MIKGVLSFIVACLLLIQCSAFQRVRVPYKLTRLRCDADKDIAAEVEADVVVSDTPLDPSVGSSPSSEVNATSAVVEDPMAAEIKAKEVELANVVARLEATLKDERLRLSSARDKLSETGKTGFFMVQAQVAEFMKKRDNEQKKRVRQNKIDFVEKMLPVIDMFREAPLKVVADTEVEKTMHNTFGALLNAIMIVIEKYGFKEFTAEEGQKLDAAKHQIAEVVEGEEEGLVVTTLRPGMFDAEGEVLRRCLVVATGKPKLDQPSEVQQEVAVAAASVDTEPTAGSQVEETNGEMQS